MAPTGREISETFSRESLNSFREKMAEDLKEGLRNRTVKNVMATTPITAFAHGVVRGVLEAKRPKDLLGSIIKYTSKMGERNARVVAVVGDIAVVYGGSAAQFELVALGEAMQLYSNLASAAAAAGQEIGEGMIHGDKRAFVAAMGKAAAMFGDRIMDSITHDTYKEAMIVADRMANRDPDSTMRSLARAFIEAGVSASSLGNTANLATDYGAKDAPSAIAGTVGVRDGVSSDPTRLLEYGADPEKQKEFQKKSEKMDKKDKKRKKKGKMKGGAPEDEAAQGEEEEEAKEDEEPPTEEAQENRLESDANVTSTTLAPLPPRDPEEEKIEEEPKIDIFDGVTENKDDDMMLCGSGAAMEVFGDIMDNMTPYTKKQRVAYRGSPASHGARAVERDGARMRNTGLATSDLRHLAKVNSKVDRSMVNPTKLRLSRRPTVRGFTGEYTTKPRQAPTGADARGARSYLTRSILAPGVAPLTKDETTRLLERIPNIRTVAVDAFTTTKASKSSSGEFEQIRSRSISHAKKAILRHY